MPIVTSDSAGIQANSLVVNTVEYRDTGVVLTVTPRVGANGEIYIDIQQEVSDVATTTTSDIDSPTIDQRKFHTQIAVESGQSVAIGGLIQTSRSRIDSGVPGLSRIPVVGAAFRQRDDSARATNWWCSSSPRWCARAPRPTPSPTSWRRA